MSLCSFCRNSVDEHTRRDKKEHARLAWEIRRESRRWQEGAGRMAHWRLVDGQVRWHNPRPWKKPYR